MIHYSCPSCQREYQSADVLAGLTVVCRDCKAPIQIPSDPSRRGDPKVELEPPPTLVAPSLDQPVEEQKRPVIVIPATFDEPAESREGDAEALDGGSGLTPGQKRGRLILLLFIMVFVLLEALALYGSYLLNDLDFKDGIRCVLTIALFACLWNGFTWAKRTAIILLTLGGVVAVLLAFGASDFILFGIAAYELGFAATLVLSSSVHEFLDYQRRPDPS